jgi:hypothetical protein
LASRPLDLAAEPRPEFENRPGDAYKSSQPSSEWSGESQKDELE